jgi:hypothetical protein
LKNHRRVPILRRHLVHPLLVEKNIAAIGLNETGQHPKNGGLAAAGRPEQKKHLARLNGEGDIVDHARIGAERLDQMVGRDGHAREFGNDITSS